MKESPSDIKLREMLGPTVFSGEGFLGKDSRPVSEIIATDLAELDRLNLTVNNIASVLEEIYNNAVNAFGGEIEAIPGVAAVYYEAMGRIPSPFGGEGTFRKGEVVVTERSSGKSIILTALSIHLIKHHSFFQGRGARYRIEPSLAADILRLA